MSSLSFKGGEEPEFPPKTARGLGMLESLDSPCTKRCGRLAWCGATTPDRDLSTGQLLHGPLRFLGGDGASYPEDFRPHRRRPAPGGGETHETSR